jgi:GST-like protein
MIDLHTWGTPNGHKVSVMLEEVGLPYRVVPVSLGDGAQHRAEFLAISPNARIPAIVDQDAEGGPLSIFESGAILIYLAEKTGRFLPTAVRPRAETMQWLMFQMGNIGPMMGQANWFANTATEKVPMAIERYINESIRLIGVLNTGLAGREYLAGEYGIADMATYPWIAAAWPLLGGEQFPDVKTWIDRVAARPAVQRGMQVPAA